MRYFNLDFIRKYKLDHIGFWLVFIFIWSFFLSESRATSLQNFLICFFYTAAIMSCYYVSNELLIPRLLYKAHYGKFVLWFLAAIFISGTFLVYSIYYVLRNPNQGGPYDKNWADNYWQPANLIYGTYMMVFFVAATGVCFRFFRDQLKTRLALETIQKEKAKTELSFLKAQINPHFLFNSLNTVYFQIDKQNTDARDTLMKFSEMLRYQLYDCNSDKINIENEIDYLKNFIELQKLRKEESYCIDYKFSDSLNGFEIAPLLLVPLVENAFKHSSNYTDRPNKVKMEAFKNAELFWFYVYNTKDKNESREVMKQGGIGLTNVKRRLQLLYPDKHQLDISDKENEYEIKLTIKL